MKKLLALLLAFLCLLSGCGAPAYQAEALTSQVSPAPAEADLNGPAALAAADFGVRLLQAADQGENILLSPSPS